MAGAFKLNRGFLEAAPGLRPRGAGRRGHAVHDSHEDLKRSGGTSGSGRQSRQGSRKARSSQDRLPADPGSARQSSQSQVPRPMSSQDTRRRSRGSANPSPTSTGDAGALSERHSTMSPPPLSETRANKAAIAMPPKLSSARSKKQELEEPDDLDTWIHSQYYATGGQKKKALTALSKDIESQGVSVHQVHEVQQILSGNSRVEVKLEYYRDHYHLSDPLQKTVQDDFMCIDPMTKEPIVNVSKLRYKGRDFMGLQQQQELNDDEDSPRPQSRASGRTSPTTGRGSPPPRNVMTPDIVASSLRDRACVQSARIERAVARGRDLELRKRLERLENLQRVMDRHSRAELERPWLKIVALSVRTAVMIKVLMAFHCAKQTTHGKVSEINPRAVKPIVTWKGLNSKACTLGLRHLQVLSKRQIAAIERIVAEQQRRENSLKRSQNAFNAWIKLLRVATFYVRVRRPLRKHFAMALIKEFLDVTSQGFRLRVAVKRYLRAVKFVQRALRHQTRIFRIVREMILEKELWAIETTVLCETVGIPIATTRVAIDAYMEANEVQLWREEVRALNVKRSKIWMGLEPPPPAYGSSDYLRRRRLSVSSSSMLEDPAPKPVPMTPKEEPGRLKRPTLIPSVGANHAKSLLRGGSTTSSVSSGQASLQRQHSGHSEDTEVDERIVALDTLRLDRETHKEMARRLLVQNIDTWWGYYNAYAAGKEEFRKFFKVWLQQVQTSAMFDVAFAPEPPEAVPYPEMVDKVLNAAELRIEMSQRILERQQQCEQQDLAAKRREAKIEVEDSDLDD
eukprot:TRINITY_DN89915_c0_g1_i1.p1 TRINITY_DN89915_c0_g1~~TRINITY_DN89915_c0_g1_i1.p1  ORF type:complete len:795 (-),score=134.36 TRINITY_DN89915_c0_g1_i1:76-2460(-)